VEDLLKAVDIFLIGKSQSWDLETFLRGPAKLSSGPSQASSKEVSFKPSTRM